MEKSSEVCKLAQTLFMSLWGADTKGVSSTKIGLGYVRLHIQYIAQKHCDHKCKVLRVVMSHMAKASPTLQTKCTNMLIYK